MRILVVMSAYNEEDFLLPNIKSLYPYVDKIAVSTTNHITGEKSTDSSFKQLDDFFMYKDKENKLILRYPAEDIKSKDYDSKEGIVKTELMNMMNPEIGDWIWVVDADEFYPERQLKMLCSRYILGHQAIDDRVHCLMVSAMVYAYDLNHFYFARHGRFFKYSKGAYFDRVNHYTWNDGTPIYGDKYGWDMPPSYLYMMHMRYVRKGVERLRNRYVYRQDRAGQKKLVWFDNVFMQYPKDKRKALRYNQEHFGVTGFDGNLSGDLKFIIDSDIPEFLSNDIGNFDLWQKIKNGG